MELRKLTKEDIDKVRHIDGFPIAKDEDIIALSNAPYYTACPNPFIEDFIKDFGKPYDEETDDYHREPFATDISEGKYDPLYGLHPYHTKVPHKAIARYILHYTKPGDIVFDGFCGTGMTGVAAHICDNPESDFRLQVENSFTKVQWGTRNAILCDLSTIATFISENSNSIVVNSIDQNEIDSLLSHCEKNVGWIYETLHTNDLTMPSLGKGRINYTVWSDVFICNHCGSEFVFWNEAVDKEKGVVFEAFNCKSCNASLRKKDCEHAFDTYFDKPLNKMVKISKQVPTLINYTYNGKRYEKSPDEHDYEVLKTIESYDLVKWFPTDRMCDGDEARRNDKLGITNIHQFYYKRSLIYLAYAWDYATTHNIKAAISKIIFRMTKRYALTYQSGVWGAGGGPTSGTLYVPSLAKELNIEKQLQSAFNDFRKIKPYSDKRNLRISTQSSADLSNIDDSSIDYIFIDPPFGSNLMYSELNYIWESWLKIKTNIKQEAIMNKTQKKNLFEYQTLMMKCFIEFYRILKPGRWMTVEFHNSKNSVWNSIQEALSRAGFVVADVRVLDKKKSSFIQITSASSVKQDLVISAYKPKSSFVKNFINNVGSIETAWDFVYQHLENLPRVVIKNGKVEIIVERQSFLLFDRMVAFHIMNGIAVPIDAVDFYKGLDERLLKRDGMYFLPDQVNEYDTARITNDVEPIQFELFVTNEKSAIAWLYQQLDNPQSYADLQPKFMQEIKAWDKFEERPELSTLLEENFLQNDEGKWYVPDVTKAADVIKLREKKLLKEFEGYLSSKGKLKLFRTEAIRVGFAKLWTDKNYKLIVETADRLPESVIQEDDKLLMYYDISLGRI